MFKITRGTMGPASLWCFQIIIILELGKTVEGTCPNLEDGVYRFGDNCDFMCHCNGTEACDFQTGECPSGCASGWYGPGCQYRNLATFGDAKHSDNVKNEQKFAKLAKDNWKDTCSSTNGPYPKTDPGNKSNTRFWKVLFKANMKERVKEMTIITTEQSLKYFSNFKVFVEHALENETGKFDVPRTRSLCYEHGPDTPTSTTINVTCNTPIIGNQVRIQTANLNTKLELCDVAISGGRNLAFARDVTVSKDSSVEEFGNISVDGRKGIVPHKEVCAQIPEYNKQRSWSVDIGFLSEIFSVYMYMYSNDTTGAYTIVISNYTSDTVEFESSGGNITLDSKFNTIGQSLTIQFDDNGQNVADTRFCEVEIYGDCPTGKCGFDCSKECHCKDEHTWDRMTAVCSAGCSGRSVPTRCEKLCSDLEWGPYCNNTCGFCEYEDGCDVVTGNCQYGCIEGYYGPGCMEECGHCKNTTCHQMSGDCLSGCEPGYHGLRCSEECHIGYYGENCAEPCSIHCADEIKACDPQNGTCITGCEPGWNGTNCNELCEMGFYGINCSGVCSIHCAGEDTDCYQINGTCVEGCQSEWTGLKCDTPVPKVGGSEDGTDVMETVTLHSGVLIGGVVVASFLFVFTVILIIKIIMKAIAFRTTQTINIGKVGNSADVSRNTLADSYENIINSEFGKKDQVTQRKEEFHYNDGTVLPWVTSTVIRLDDFRNYIDKALTNRTYHIQLEYILYGLHYPHNAALKTKNRQKCRYKDMCAYDHTRVVLKSLPGKPDSDFIDASHIRGFLKSNAYIAAQGPTEDSIYDLWRLVWEENITVIVMVTNLVEHGETKCTEYWADIGCRVKYGDITISTEKEVVYAEYVKRQFSVTFQGQTDGERIITQFQYTAWPDHCVPNSTTGLLNFLYQVRKCDQKKIMPWLVHCSDGAGRTGTFIALDILWDMGEHLNKVDVYQCVNELRPQRANMIETKEQYKYLHSVLLEALVLPSEPIHMDQFQKHYTDITEDRDETGITRLLQEFLDLVRDMDLLVCCNNDGDFLTAMSPENLDKNRYGRILAANKYRPYLTTRVPDTTDYINAVYIPSYHDSRGYIVTQVPLKNTTVDCCRLIYEEDTNVIVTFDNKNVVEAGEYLPKDGMLHVGPFEIEKLSEQILFDYNIKSYQITYNKETKIITQLEFDKWPTGQPLPDNPRSILNFLMFVDKFRKQEVNSRLVVQCQNGAEKGGLFVVMMNILEQVKAEKKVSIPQVVRRAKFIRRNIISTVEQYKYCHDLLQIYAGTSASRIYL